MKDKKWIPIALSLTIAGLLFSPALSMLGYGPDSVSGATSVPRSTTTAPAQVPTSTAYSNTPSTWAQDALQQASLAGLTFDSLMSQFNKPITRHDEDWSHEEDKDDDDDDDDDDEKDED